MAASAGHIELEARIEGIRLELNTMTATRGDLEARLREGQHQLERRGDELESKVEHLRSELEDLYQARNNLEGSFKDTQQTLARSVDALRDAAVKDLESVRQDIDQVAGHVQRQEQRLDQRLCERFDQRFSAMRVEVAKETHTAEEAREQAAQAADAIRREASPLRTDM